ncbi:MAG: flagellar basal body L-ring protein FlgH [Candidatus Nitrohelix vancouverensis]|uniref:Flagellar L-ring protein n=1 Tax=Candidatus Nitrohelix vancouverensis TaxID=2705534 RepID=A0A7T0G2K5_9BACT|nr:MAG: flagellar basal body L-ring protein FlgH [Candidatus Nitrohelix vancouverensis]
MKLKTQSFKVPTICARILACLAATMLASCAGSQRAVDPAATVVPDKIYEVASNNEEGSLWPGDTAKNLFFEDTKAQKVGDIVTVTVNESATSSQTATTNTSRSSNTSVSTGPVLGLPGNLGIQNFLNMGTSFDPNIGVASTDLSHQGNGTTTRNGSLTMTLSAQITQILPNGNLHIEGKRSVTVNNEEQYMILTGVIRPEDVGFDNTISSTLIANASITYSGSGDIADPQRVGWMAKVISYIWPF